MGKNILLVKPINHSQFGIAIFDRIKEIGRLFEVQMTIYITDVL